MSLFGVPPHLATCIFLLFPLLNEQRLGAGINTGMALTPVPSSIGWDSNPQTSNCKSSLLTTRPDFRPNYNLVYNRMKSKIKVIEDVVV